MGAVGLSVPASTRSSKPSLAFWVSLLGGWQGGAVRTKSETDLRGGTSACPCKGLKSLSLPFSGDSWQVCGGVGVHVRKWIWYWLGLWSV